MHVIAEESSNHRSISATVGAFGAMAFMVEFKVSGHSVFFVHEGPKISTWPPVLCLKLESGFFFLCTATRT